MPKFIQTILLLVCFAFTTNTQAQIINIPDANFKSFLLNNDYLVLDSNGMGIHVDTNNDNEIEVSEILGVHQLEIYYADISSLTGIQYFTNLQVLNCRHNLLTNLNLSGLAKLKELNCEENQLTSLNINGLTKLVKIDCDDNKLTSLNLNGLTNLKELNCERNQLTSLNTNGLTQLKILSCGVNQLSTLNINRLYNLESIYCSVNFLLTTITLTELPALTQLECWQNQLSTLTVNNLHNLQSIICSGNLLTSLNLDGLLNLVKLDCNQNKLTTLNVNGLINLERLDCHNNKLTTLDLSSLKKLTVLDCSSNELFSIYMKNGIDNSANISGFSLYNNSLKYICADTTDLAELRLEIRDSNVIINSFCNSTLNGVYQIIKGAVKIDLNNNGCDPQDLMYPNLKIKIKNLIDSGYIISDEFGDFAINVSNGTYTLIPQFSHPYFTLLPTSATITLPDTIMPSFCITPNGTHHDVSVTVIPIRAARPGFSDAKYKIVLKNKGNQIESGTILFKYDENKQDFISASTTPTSIASGELTFAFSNLQIFETREIIVTMRTNAPTDNPAVNAGDVLNVQVGATLDNGVRDEYIKDNFKNIKQTVVGSIDPNDKTCLEGKIATPDVIGDFVNYLIRFENTGTANAENVVVTDFIDLNKFDISTLELTSTSHSCKTVISNGNKVQFVFDNINLPYTDPNKYGYVAFKITTKSNLVIGDSLKNTADIYFDYNLPIKTNTAATRIDNIILSTKIVTTKEGSLSVYPNPSTGNFIINFESKGNFPITIKMMDLKGSVVLEKNINHTEKSTLTIDDKNISNGIYLINIHTEKENWLQKLMIVK